MGDAEYEKEDFIIFNCRSRDDGLWKKRST